jgi:hypothetical protein
MRKGWLKLSMYEKLREECRKKFLGMKDMTNNTFMSALDKIAGLLESEDAKCIFLCLTLLRMKHHKIESFAQMGLGDALGVELVEAVRETRSFQNGEGEGLAETRHSGAIFLAESLYYCTSSKYVAKKYKDPEAEKTSCNNAIHFALHTKAVQQLSVAGKSLATTFLRDFARETFQETAIELETRGLVEELNETLPNTPLTCGLDPGTWLLLISRYGKNSDWKRLTKEA